MIGNEDNISIVYQILGAFCLLGGIILGALLVVYGRAIDLYAIGLVAILIIAALALLRPTWLDNFLKNIADRLPFFRYSKPE
jgi:hypothetical protein